MQKGMISPFPYFKGEALALWFTYKNFNKVNVCRINPDIGAKNEENTFTQSNSTRIGEFP